MKLFSLIQKIEELKLRRQRSCGSILMFHRVDDIMKAGSYKDALITLINFKRLILDFNSRGYEFAKLEDIENLDELNEKKVFITFDDGTDDLHRNVYPFLKEHKFPFAVFVVSEFISKPGYLSQRQLVELVEGGLCTVGAHTKSHLLLRKASSATSKAEIVDCKADIERIINREVSYFAYPYGSAYAVSKRDVNYAREGYKLAFSTFNSHLSQLAFKNMHFLPRINVDNDNWQRLGRLKFWGTQSV